MGVPKILIKLVIFILFLRNNFTNIPETVLDDMGLSVPIDEHHDASGPRFSHEIPLEMRYVRKRWGNQR